MTKKIKFFLLFFVVVFFIFGIYKIVISSGARDVKAEKSEFVVQASKIIDEFTTNSESATTKYLNKAIEISGKVTAVDKNVITINEKISCQLQTETLVSLSSIVMVKGRVTGYDDLLEEIKLDQCLIKNRKN
jgi:hypothetical protein